VRHFSLRRFAIRDLAKIRFGEPRRCWLSGQFVYRDQYISGGQGRIAAVEMIRLFVIALGFWCAHAQAQGVPLLRIGVLFFDDSAGDGGRRA
jgi:hypothetical protein